MHKIKMVYLSGFVSLIVLYSLFFTTYTCALSVENPLPMEYMDRISIISAETHSPTDSGDEAHLEDIRELLSAMESMLVSLMAIYLVGTFIFLILRMSGKLEFLKFQSYVYISAFLIAVFGFGYLAYLIWGIFYALATVVVLLFLGYLGYRSVLSPDISIEKSEKEPISVWKDVIYVGKRSYAGGIFFAIWMVLSLYVAFTAFGEDNWVSITGLSFSFISYGGFVSSFFSNLKLYREGIYQRDILLRPEFVTWNCVADVKKVEHFKGGVTISLEMNKFCRKVYGVKSISISPWEVDDMGRVYNIIKEILRYRKSASSFEEWAEEEKRLLQDALSKRHISQEQYNKRMGKLMEWVSMICG
jgi:hypothetical protein